MFAINEEENTTQCKLIQHGGYGGRRAGKGTALQNLPKQSTRQAKSTRRARAQTSRTKAWKWCRDTVLGRKHLPFQNRYRAAIWFDQKLLPSRAPAQHMNRPSRDTKQNKAFWKKVHFNIPPVKCLGRGRKTLSWAGWFGLFHPGHLKEPPLSYQLDARSP